MIYVKKVQVSKTELSLAAYVRVFAHAHATVWCHSACLFIRFCHKIQAAWPNSSPQKVGFQPKIHRARPNFYLRASQNHLSWVLLVQHAQRTYAESIILTNIPSKVTRNSTTG